jgi:replication-associated recombination protein RarA
MSTLYGNLSHLAGNGSAQLTERYRPHSIQDFVGLDKPKLVCSQLAANPQACALLFVGPSGTGKTTMARALAEAIGAELHHIPSQECSVERLRDVVAICHYAPMCGSKHSLVLVDEADQMSKAAQVSLLSTLDNLPPDTIFVFTCNETERLEDRFLSRVETVKFSSEGLSSDATALLERVWREEAPATAAGPNFSRIVKDSKNNIRKSLMALQTELRLAKQMAI